MRGFSASSRWPDTSNAYSRPVDRMAAPRARVLPPAPAQKSTTISPRLASVSSASNWLPSSCTSTSPRLNNASFCSAGLPTTRMPQGENGVGAALMPRAFSSVEDVLALGLQRVDPQVQRGRFVQRAHQRPEALIAQLVPAARWPASRAGCGAAFRRSWRGRCHAPARAIAARWGRQGTAQAGCCRPAQARMARRRSSAPWPLCARCWYRVLRRSTR